MAATPYRQAAGKPKREVAQVRAEKARMVSTTPTGISADIKVPPATTRRVGGLWAAWPQLPTSPSPKLICMLPARAVSLVHQDNRAALLVLPNAQGIAGAAS